MSRAEPRSTHNTSTPTRVSCGQAKAILRRVRAGRRRSPHPIASARTWVVENLTCEHVANIVSFGGFVRVDRAVPRRTGGDLAVSGWEPQPAASVFLPNIARLSSTAAHYESDRTNRNERFAARHGRFRPQAVQEPETAAGGEILRRQTQCRQTGPPPFLPGPITESDDGDVIGNIDFQGHEFFRDTQRGHDRRQHDGGWGWAFCKQAR